jgi:hypothetical protein
VIKISHYGVCATDGIVNGTFTPAGSVLRTTKEVPEAEAVDWLRNDKKLLHRAFDHRRSLENCREDLCGKIQHEIDGLSGHESLVTDHESRSTP